jgi:hypothetical protein
MKAGSKKIAVGTLRRFVAHAGPIRFSRKFRNTRRKTVRDPARQKGRLCAPPAVGRKRCVNAHPSPTAVNEHGATRDGIRAALLH